MRKGKLTTIILSALFLASYGGSMESDAQQMADLQYKMANGKYGRHTQLGRQK